MSRKVRVYQDPITRKDYEGEADLIEEFGEFNENGLKVCAVEFPADRFGGRYGVRGYKKFYRKIHRDDFIRESE